MNKIKLISAMTLGLALVGGVALAATEPVISSVAVSSTPTTATITWNTDEGANAQVLYGTSTPLMSSTTVTTNDVTNQSVVLSGLTPNTTYDYAVVSADTLNNTNSSTIATFTTASSTASLMASVASGTPGSTFSVSGAGFTASEMVALNFNGATSSANADLNGDFSTMLTIPSTTVNTDTPVTITAVGDSSGLTAMANFTIVPSMPSSTTATSTPSSTVASITVNPTSGMAGSMFSVSGTGFNASEMIDVSFNGATSTTNADTNGNFSSTLTAPSGITGSIFVEAMGVSSGRTAGTWFDIMPSSTIATSTPDLTTLQNEITQLQAIIANLVTEVESLLSGRGSGTGSGSTTGSGSGSSSSTLAATIDPVGPIRTGTSVDFTGRNWEANEQVQVANGGSVITTAQADGGGNFSTGSLSVNDATGTQVYTFTGMTSGIVRSVDVTVTQ